MLPPKRKNPWPTFDSLEEAEAHILQQLPIVDRNQLRAALGSWENTFLKVQAKEQNQWQPH